MKVKVTFTVDVDEDSRRLINQYYGLAGVADRSTVRDFYLLHGVSGGEMLASEAMALEEDQP